MSIDCIIEITVFYEVQLPEVKFPIRDTQHTMPLLNAKIETFVYCPGEILIICSADLCSEVEIQARITVLELRNIGKSSGKPSD